MDEFLPTSSSPAKLNHFAHLSLMESEGGKLQNQHQQQHQQHQQQLHHGRHHSNTYSYGSSSSYVEKSKRETDHLRERLRACENGMGTIYQVCGGREGEGERERERERERGEARISYV